MLRVSIYTVFIHYNAVGSEIYTKHYIQIGESIRVSISKIQLMFALIKLRPVVVFNQNIGFSLL